MRTAIILMILTVAGCSSKPYHELAQTSKSDPVWQLNPDKWTFGANALTTPPSGQ